MGQTPQFDLREIEEAIRTHVAPAENDEETVTTSVASVEGLNGDGTLLVHGRLRRQAPGRIADQDVWWVCSFENGVLARLEAHNERPSPNGGSNRAA